MIQGFLHYKIIDPFQAATDFGASFIIATLGYLEQTCLQFFNTSAVKLLGTWYLFLAVAGFLGNRLAGWLQRMYTFLYRSGTALELVELAAVDAMSPE